MLIVYFFMCSISYQKKQKKVNKNVEKKIKNVDKVKKVLISVKLYKKSIDRKMKILYNQ